MQTITRMIPDMDPADIQAEITKKGLTQAAIARALGVTPVSVSDCIHGWFTSRRIHEAIAEAIGKDIKEIWPSTYLYRTPRKGRPRVEWLRKIA